MTVEQIIPLLQDAARDRGFLFRFAQHIKALRDEVDEMGERITQHGQDHEVLAETIVDRVKDELLRPILAALQQRKEEPVSTATGTQLPPLSQAQWDAMTAGVDSLKQDLEARQVPELPHEPEAMAGAWNSLLEGPVSEDPVAVQALQVVFETMQRLIAFIEQLRDQIRTKDELCGKATGFIRGLKERIQQLEKK
jgi:hypothetical protein